MARNVSKFGFSKATDVLFPASHAVFHLLLSLVLSSPSSPLILASIFLYTSL